MLTVRLCDKHSSKLATRPVTKPNKSEEIKGQPTETKQLSCEATQLFVTWLEMLVQIIAAEMTQ